MSAQEQPNPQPPAVQWPIWRWVALLAAFCVVVVYVRIAVDAQSALSRAQDAEGRGDRDEAVFQYRVAARAYVPLLPANESALDALLRLGSEAEAREAWMDALNAYDAVRVGTLGARWMLVPHADKLAQANVRLPEVMVEARRTHPLAPEWREEDRDALLAEFQEAVARDFLPPPGLALLASGGFVAWLVAIFGAIWRGVRPDGSFNRPALLRWAGAAAVALICWLGALVVLALRGGGA